MYTNIYIHVQGLAYKANSSPTLRPSDTKCFPSVNVEDFKHKLKTIPFLLMFKAASVHKVYALNNALQYPHFQDYTFGVILNSVEMDICGQFIDTCDRVLYLKTDSGLIIINITIFFIRCAVKSYLCCWHS